MELPPEHSQFDFLILMHWAPDFFITALNSRSIFLDSFWSWRSSCSFLVSGIPRGMALCGLILVIAVATHTPRRALVIRIGQCSSIPDTFIVPADEVFDGLTLVFDEWLVLRACCYVIRSWELQWLKIKRMLGSAAFRISHFIRSGERVVE